MKVARGKSITFNDLKHLVHPVENGTIPDTRYRACKFPGGGTLPRILLMNGTGDYVAKWFALYGFGFLTPILVALAAGKTQVAIDEANALQDADEKAVLRRITFAFPTKLLVAPSLIASLTQETSSASVAEQTTLAAWYAKHDAEK
jgi:hypothetical protein